MSNINYEIGAFDDAIHNPEVAEINSRTQQIDINGVPVDDLKLINPNDPRLASASEDSYVYQNNYQCFYKGVIDGDVEVVAGGEDDSTVVSAVYDTANKYVEVTVVEAPLAEHYPLGYVQIDGKNYDLGKIGIIVDNSDPSNVSVTYNENRKVLLNLGNKPGRIIIFWGDGKVENIKFPQL